MSRNYGICQYLVETWQRLMGRKSLELAVDCDESDSLSGELMSPDFGNDSPESTSNAPQAPRRPICTANLVVIIYERGDSSNRQVLKAWSTSEGVKMMGEPSLVNDNKTVVTEGPHGRRLTYGPADGDPFLLGLLERYNDERRSAYYPGALFAERV